MDAINDDKDDNLERANVINQEIIKTKPKWKRNALVNKNKYQKKYIDSIKNNNEFWKKEGKRISWIKP